MQKELPVAFRALNGGVDGLDLRTSQLFDRGGDLGHGDELRTGVAHDPTFADLFPSDLKLRLHQHHQLPWTG